MELIGTQRWANNKKSELSGKMQYAVHRERTHTVNNEWKGATLTV